MTDVLERAFISTPFAARNTHQAVVPTFEPLDDGVRLPEHGPETRLACCAVGIVPYAFSIRGLGVELVLQICLCQLAECARVEAEEVEHLVEAGDVDGWRSVSWGW